MMKETFSGGRGGGTVIGFCSISSSETVVNLKNCIKERVKKKKQEMKLATPPVEIAFVCNFLLFFFRKKRLLRNFIYKFGCWQMLGDVIKRVGVSLEQKDSGKKFNLLSGKQQKVM